MVIGFIGAGSMASALARGLGEPALVGPAHHGRAQELAAEIGGEALGSSAEIADRADVVVLTHKPKHLETVVAELDGRARAVASMLAATPLATLEDAFPGVPVYRFMPNIPVEVGRGVLAYTPGTLAEEGPEDELLSLLGRLGTVVEVEERLMDAAMGMLGVTPAFLALVVEAMAGAGQRHGLDAHTARRLLVESMAGTAAYLDAHELDGAALSGRVATPGGLTERGLDLLAERDVGAAFADAVDRVVDAAS